MISVLCGGTGGVKLVDGLAAVLADPSELTVIVNTADDWEHLGLSISPDVDTVLYMLAGLASDERGWGIEGDTWTALEMLGRYGAPAWFRLGDRDLGTHLARTLWLREGRRPTEVTAALAAGLGVVPRVLPMTDGRVATFVHTSAGRLPFQEYFVLRGARDAVHRIEFEGIDRARPSPEVLETIRDSALIIVSPSNPLVSIGPILALHGMDAALGESAALRVAVTPLIGGAAVKGPTVEMLRGVGMRADPAAVAAMYRRFIDVFLLDVRDRALTESVAAAGCDGVAPRASGPWAYGVSRRCARAKDATPLNDYAGVDDATDLSPRGGSQARRLAVECADTLMTDRAGRKRLAREILDLARVRGMEVAAKPA